MTGLLAWEYGQPGQVGNEAALTATTSAEIGLVNLPHRTERDVHLNGEPGFRAALRVMKEVPFAVGEAPRGPTCAD